MLNFWFKLDDKIRFLIIGGFNFAISYLMYSAFCVILGINLYQIALALAWILSSFVSYTTQRYLVFSSRGNIIKEYVKCCSTWIISYIVNACLLELCVKTIHLNVFIAQIIATFMAACVTYILFKNFAFNNK